MSNYEPDAPENDNQPVTSLEHKCISLKSLIELYLRDRTLKSSGWQPSWSVRSDLAHTKSDLRPRSQSSELFAVQEGLQGQEIRIQSNRGEKMMYGHFPSTPEECTTSVALLPNNGTDQAVRVVWNQEAQESYSVLDKQCRHLPSIIERSRAGLLSSQSRGNGNSQDALEYGSLLTDLRSNLTATAGEEIRLALLDQESDGGGTKRRRESNADKASPSLQTRAKRQR